MVLEQNKIKVIEENLILMMGTTNSSEQADETDSKDDYGKSKKATKAQIFVNNDKDSSIDDPICLYLRESAKKIF